MSSEKHGNLSLHKWAPTDRVLMTEFNDNFKKLDDKAKEIMDATEDTDGVAQPNLRARLASDFGKVNVNLAQTMTQIENIAINVNNFPDLKTAMEADVSNDLLFPSGTYNINALITATLKGNRKWVTSGKVVFKYTGSTNDIMMLVNVNGFAFEMDGDFLFDGDNKAREGLLVQNISVTMDNVPDIHLKNVKAENIYSSTVGKSARGITVQGGFNNVTLDDLKAKNVSRAAGVGVVGAQGTNGITVTDVGKAYAKNIFVNNPHLENITSEEQDGSPNNVDCDGLGVFGSFDSNSKLMEATFYLNGGKFIDCRGRSIKSQILYNFVKKPTFIKKNVKTISNGNEIDAQYGMLSVDGFTAMYNPLQDGSSPFGSSFVMFQATLRGNRKNNDAYVDVRDGEIINNVNVSTPIPYFALVNSGVSETFTSVKVDNIKHIGAGRISRFVYGDINKVELLFVDNNNVSWIVNPLVGSRTSTNSNGSISHNYRVNRSANLDLCDNVRMIHAVNNIGFNKVLTNITSTNATNAIRVNQITAPEATASGSFTIEQKTIADDETYAFSQRGGGNGQGIYFINATFNHHTGGAFVANSNSIEPIANTVSTVIEYGSGANPDIDGKLNVWMENGVCKVKNRLGSSRHVTLSHIG